MLEKYKYNNVKTHYWIIVVLISLFVLLNVATSAIRIGYKFEIDYNEGFNVYTSIKAASGKNLYDSKENEWTPNNYPPISFYVVGFISKILGHPLIIGRTTSLISLLFIAICVGIVVTKLGGTAYDAVFSGVFCLGLFTTYANHIVGMNDPQMLGQLFSMIGLMIYLSNRSNNINLFFAAFFFCLGFFTKHNLVAIPAAVIIDIMLRSRKDLIIVLSYVSFISLCSILLIMHMSGSNFINEVFLVETSRIYSIRRLIDRTMNLGHDLQIPLIAILPVIIISFKQKPLRIISFYFAVSFALGMYFSGGSGTDINMFFDVFLSIAIASGINILFFRNHLLGKFKYSRFVYCIIPVILSIGIMMKLPNYGFTINKYFTFINKENIFLEDAAFIESQPGSAICESNLMCYFGGKKFEYDPFPVQQALLAGKYDERKIIKRLESGDIRVVQLKNNTDYISSTTINNEAIRIKGRFTENILNTIRKNYLLVRKTENGMFYIFQNRDIGLY